MWHPQEYLNKHSKETNNSPEPETITRRHQGHLLLSSLHWYKTTRTHILWYRKKTNWTRLRPTPPDFDWLHLLILAAQMTQIWTEAVRSLSVVEKKEKKNTVTVSQLALFWNPPDRQTELLSGFRFLSLLLPPTCFALSDSSGGRAPPTPSDLSPFTKQ